MSAGSGTAAVAVELTSLLLGGKRNLKCCTHIFCFNFNLDFKFDAEGSLN